MVEFVAGHRNSSSSVVGVIVMAYIMVCNVDTPPPPGEACPPQSVEYYQNFWDSGMTMAQTTELIGYVVLLWVVAYVFKEIRRVF